MEAVAKRPGQSLRSVAKATTLHAGVARHHVRILEKRREVRVDTAGHAWRIFPASDAAHAVAPHEDALHQLFAWLAKECPVNQAAILRQGQIWKWPAATTRHRIQRLLHAGLLRRDADAFTQLTYTLVHQTADANGAL